MTPETPDAVVRSTRRRVTTEVGRVETWLLDQGVPSVVRYAAGRRTIARVTLGLVLIFVLDARVAVASAPPPV